MSEKIEYVTGVKPLTVQIKDPTVGQLREFLAQFDQTAPLLMRDTASGLVLSIVHAETGWTSRVVWLSGSTNIGPWQEITDATR